MEFEQALALVREGTVRPGGIGVLQEKTLHATLKLWLDSDQSHHEVPLPGGCVADIYDGQRVTEIQTGNYSALRPKLQKLLDTTPVTVVCPLVQRKWVRWIDPATGMTGEPHRSPRIGSFADAGPQLVYLLPCLRHPNLTLRLVLLDVEEHRLADGWSRDGKRGSHRAERLPLSLVAECRLETPGDYRALVPPTLGDTFTAAEFSKAARQQGRKLNGTLKVLLDRGVVTRQKEGKGYRYTVTR